MTRATTMAFIGDLIFDKRCSAAAEAGRPQDVWGDVLPLLRGVDAVIANLEVPLTSWPHRWQRTFKPVRLCAVPAAVNLLSAANIAFVNFANNHTLDREVEGLAETLRLLDGAGIARAGDGTVRMTGGYYYASNTDYCGGQYLDLLDGEWIYDIAKNQ